MPYDDEVGPSLPTSVLYGRAGDACNCTDGPEVVPLPPEQRGKIHRALADDEGNDGRWMDIPRPEEIWGGAVGLTRDAFCLLLPVSGAPPPGAEDVAKPAKEAPQEEGIEMRENVAHNKRTDRSAGVGAGAAAKDSDDEEYRPDCITRAPELGCLPAPPCVDGEEEADSGVKARTQVRLRPYFRELPEDAGNCPPPNECFADMVTVHVQMASAMYVRFLCAA